MDWDRLRIFYEAAATGNFTNAAIVLDLCQSAVSRQVRALERDLRVQLFRRHARGLTLTEAGESLYRTACEIAACLSEAETVLQDTCATPRGPLVVSTTIGFGTYWLAPRLAEFHEAFPDIKLTLLLDGGESDLTMRDADIAIRLGPPQRMDWVQRRLFTQSAHLYASPGYLRQYGVPLCPSDLDNHRLITYRAHGKSVDGQSEWVLDAGAAPNRKRQPILQLDNIAGALAAVEGGLGVAAFPPFAVSEGMRLTRIMPDHAAPDAVGYFVYPSEARCSKRMSVFRDFVLRKLSDQPG